MVRYLVLTLLCLYNPFYFSGHPMSDALREQVLSRLPSQGRLWVGFSGGLDSSVLLQLLAAIPALRPRLSAIHVHHGLSANAGAWQSHCAEVCRQAGVPLVCEQVVVEDRGDGVEEAARRARYQAFGRHLQPGDTLLLAHHADDQIETLFQRLLRGAGLSGLQAMAESREWQPGIRLLRPLLYHTRAELEQLAQQWQLSWIEDESNQDSRYERNWWRNQLLPQIFSRFPHKKNTLLRTVRQLQQDQQALALLLEPRQQACLADSIWPGVRGQALDLDALAVQEALLRPYLIRGWLQTAGLGLPSAAWLDTLQQEVIDAGADRQPQLAIGDCQVQRFRQHLYVVQPPQVPQEGRLLLQHGHQQLPWGNAMLNCETERGFGLRPGEYRLLPAREVRGRTLRQHGRPSKGLKALFQEADVPVWLRDSWPAVLAGDELVALAGIALAEQVAIAGGWQLSWKN